MFAIDAIDVVFGAFWGISIGFMSSIIKFLLLLYILLPFSSSFGGFTGLISANSIIDTILHDSYFIIGHLHYVLSLGAIYTISAAFYTYWVFF